MDVDPATNLITRVLKNAEATAEAFEYGWFHSGDSGRLDPDGMLWFNDRYKDVIKSGGENVASIEVEKALYAADERIAEVAVVGLPHERWTEAITAFVVAKPGETLDEAEVIEAVRAHIAGFKAPKAVIVVDELPKTSTGKIQKEPRPQAVRRLLRIVVCLRDAVPPGHLADRPLAA